MSDSMNNSFIVNGSKELLPKHAYTYHMNWDTLQIEQPNKINVLERWFEVIGRRPNKNSVLVFDVTDQMVYVSVGLGYCVKNPYYQKTRNMVLKCLDEGTRFHSYRKNEDENPYEGHRFISVEDTPIIILEDALDSYKEREKNAYTKAKAYDALEKILTEIKTMIE